MKTVESFQLTPGIGLLVDHERKEFILHHTQSNVLIYLESFDELTRLGFAISRWTRNYLDSLERSCTMLNDILAQGLGEITDED